MTFNTAFLAQAEACESLGSPFTADLLRLVADNIRPGTAVADRLLNWPGDISGGGASVPLRLAGALHGLVLNDSAPELKRNWPPYPTDKAMLWHAIETAFRENEAELMHWLDSAPQTNEVRRSAALIAAASVLSDKFHMPFKLSELGASAGLNLYFDRYALELPDGSLRGRESRTVHLSPEWTGPLPPLARLRVMEREGIDLNPLDPTDEKDALRLRAYTWADQPDRLERLDAVLPLTCKVVTRGDAAEWLVERLAAPIEGEMHLVFNTIAWQYFSAETQAACQAALDEAGSYATQDAPLAHLSVENDGRADGAAIKLTVWPGGKTRTLGRMDFHGRWINWAG